MPKRKVDFIIDDSSRPKEGESRENFSSRDNPLPPMPSCYRCNGEMYITHFGRGADDGHDITVRCPVCNPKNRDYDDDRDWYDDPFYGYKD